MWEEEWKANIVIEKTAAILNLDESLSLKLELEMIVLKFYEYNAYVPAK